MSYLESIQNFRNQPAELEALYQAALSNRNGEQFATDLIACYNAEPHNLLLAAWYYRLQAKAPESAVKRLWGLAVPLAVLAGLALWAIFDENNLFASQVPHLMVFWAPLAGLFILAFLAIGGRRAYGRALIAGTSLAAASAYVFFMIPGMKGLAREHTTILMMIHLPLLTWIAVGFLLLGNRSQHGDRFAFLIKSFEVFVTAGVYLIAGVAFTAVTVGMFDALNVEIPAAVMRLMVAGGLGLVSVLAVASIYDPRFSPLGQDFQQGLSRFIATLMRLLLPLTLLVLAVYLVAIPFNFMAPFQEREVLIVYNAMLFGVIGMLIGATPVRLQELSPQVGTLLRRGILAAAIMALLVSLYALAAILYRTFDGGITINRLTVIGWNSINIGILVLAIIRLLRIPTGQDWAAALQRVFGAFMIAYIVWDVFIIFAIPLLFRSTQ
jgi:hypothetical protein